MSDLTITALRTTLLRVPWPQTPWLKGHAFSDARNLLVLDVETKGGIVGMGYLFSFRPGLRSVAMALQEAILPRVIGNDATAVEGIWNDIPILQPDPMRGGFTDLRKIAVLADTWGMTIAPHLFPELNVQLLASIPNGI